MYLFVNICRKRKKSCARLTDHRNQSELVLRHTDHVRQPTLIGKKRAAMKKERFHWPLSRTNTKAEVPTKVSMVYGNGQEIKH